MPLASLRASTTRYVVGACRACQLLTSRVCRRLMHAFSRKGEAVPQRL